MEPKFGEIFYAALSGDGHVQAGNRPVLIAQNDIGNHFSPTVEVIPISSRIEKARRKHLPTQVIVAADHLNGLSEDSVILKAHREFQEYKAYKQAFAKLK